MLFFEEEKALSEGAGLEVKPGMFVEPGHEIHVLNGLSAGAFEEVVDNGRDEQLVFYFLNVNKCLIGVDYLLEVYVAVDIMREGSCLVELFVELYEIFF